MPKGKGIYDDINDQHDQGDESKTDSEATREDAPDVADTGGEPTA
jgi:hypothetical protein